MKDYKSVHLLTWCQFYKSSFFMKSSFQIFRKMTVTSTTNCPQCWIGAYWVEFIRNKRKSIDATNGEETERESNKGANLFCPDPGGPSDLHRDQTAGSSA